MNTFLRPAAAVFALCLLAPSTRSYAQHAAMPPGMTHEEHLAQMRKDAELKKRGAAAMGFDQDKAVHHFLVAPDGGVIQIEAGDGADPATIEAIRTHLREIATAFAAGRFDAPFATHAEVPPGVPALQRLKSAVTYSFEETRKGGRVLVVTKNAEALSAIHDFFRYQIREHRTGD